MLISQNFLQKMTEIIQLLKENNIMLKYICNYIINQVQTQDIKEFLSNVAADMYVESLTKGK